MFSFPTFYASLSFPVHHIPKCSDDCPFRWISGVVETRSRIVNDDVGDRLEVIVDDTRVSESILAKISPRLEELRVPVDQLSER